MPLHQEIQVKFFYSTLVKAEEFFFKCSKHLTLHMNWRLNFYFRKEFFNHRWIEKVRCLNLSKVQKSFTLEKTLREILLYHSRCFQIKFGMLPCLRALVKQSSQTAQFEMAIQASCALRRVYCTRHLILACELFLEFP